MGRHTTSGVAKQGRTPRTRRGFNVAVEEHAAKNGFPSVIAARVDFCLRPATAARRLALSNARYLPPARVPHPHATASLWDTSRETAGPPPDCSPTVRLPRTRGHCLFSDESTPLPSIIVSSSLPAYAAAGFPLQRYCYARERRASRRRVQDVDCGPSEQDVWWADGQMTLTVTPQRRSLGDRPRRP